MENFQEYLRSKHKMRPASIEIYSRAIESFLSWAGENKVKTCSKPELLEYLSFMQNSAVSQWKQRSALTALRHYFNHLIEQQQADHNPATGLYIKPAVRTVASVPLETGQLQRLYEQIEVRDGRTLVCKVVTGLLVYQALTTREITLLQVRDLNLNTGKITLPQTHLTGGRTLKLDGSQIAFLQRYLKEFTPDTYLLPTVRAFIKNDNRPASNFFSGLLRKLRTIVPAARNALYIRQSVIAQWTKLYDIRVVQYMAGHKWVSSTQRYDTAALETLQNELQQYHPLQ